MEYFYLDENNSPQGPYSKDDLTHLCADEIITIDTLIAAKGDSDWQPFGKFYKDHSSSVWDWVGRAIARAIGITLMVGIGQGWLIPDGLGNFFDGLLNLVFNIFLWIMIIVLLLVSLYQMEKLIGSWKARRKVRRKLNK